MRLLPVFVVPSTAITIALSLAIFSSAHAAPAESLSVKRLVLAHGIEGREPQSPSTSFDSKDDRVYAFVEIENTTKSEKTINVVFEPPSGSGGRGSESSSDSTVSGPANKKRPAFAAIPLKVGDGARFRTWAFTRRAHDKGEWAVVVRSGDAVLGRQAFTVK